MDAVAATLVVGLVGVAVVRELWWQRRFRAIRESLHAAHSRAREGEEAAALGALVTNLAQGLKAPLQGLLGGTELMLAGQTDAGPTAEDIQELHQEASRAAGIIRHLSAFTDSQSLSRRWLNLNEVVAGALQATRPLLEAAGTSVAFTPADRLPLVYLDGRQVGKVLETLLGSSDGTGGPLPQGFQIRTFRTDDTVSVSIVAHPVRDVSQDAEWSAGLAASHRVLTAHGGGLRFEQAGDDLHITLELPVGESAPAAVLS